VRDPFAGVVGQEAAVASLRAILRAGGGAGSTLLWGPEGCGRFLLAHRAACAILGPKAEGLAHSDLHLLDGNEEGLDEVRERLPRLGLRPSEGDRPVLLVRDLDRFAPEVHDALLKTLEEPPAGAAILLVASEPSALPETVVSRCRLVRVRALPEAAVRALLRARGLDEAAAADAEGSIGRAIFHLEANVAEDAARILALSLRRAGDPLGEAEKLARAKPGEEPARRRARQAEILRVAAARARRMLPSGESALRRFVERLGSLQRNANPSIVFADLALTAWKRPPNPS